MNSLRLRPTHLLALLAGVILTGSLHAQSDKATVSGTFLGDGKDGKIQHLVVQTREPFSDQAAIRLVFTEKNPSASKKPDFDAGFKKLGSALIISVFKDGGIFGCEVAHTAHSKSPFSSVGVIKMEGFTVTDTQVSGRLTTGKEQEFFGQTWNVDLTFSAPLPKGAFAAEAAESPSTTKKMEKEKEKEESEPFASGPKLPIADLPLPTGARDIEYKSVVGHILFKADAPVSTVATDFSKKLKAQGWQDGAGGLISKSNAILKRKLNGADLTIMIQPEGTGSNVKVFTQGLDWSKTPASTAGAGSAPASKPATPNVEDIEKEANKALQDALKGIPGIKL
ncbi:hypothetical protein [Verrucomicrobium sp. BvORR034]|uniref:hypothetical protein n=1 Tax=Verrucomicrobium sp. BvORR034 TaxID=1396418 RepID=UPI000678788E|nr:hypothetical protein [Verrucomicrobium sp. BvORR034]